MKKISALLLLFALLVYSGLLTAESAAPEGKYEIEGFLVYLRMGSVRLNWDEWPLITGENYKLILDGKTFSKYAWKEREIKRAGDELVIVSEDSAGSLERKLSFFQNGFKMTFRLNLKKTAQGKGQFFYNLDLAPGFFYGIENNADLNIYPQDGKTYRFAPFKKVDGKTPPDQSVGNWRKLLLSWHGMNEERKMEITLTSPENTATGIFRDFRKRYGKYLLSVLFREIPKSGIIQFEIEINLI